MNKVQPLLSIYFTLVLAWILTWILERWMEQTGNGMSEDNIATYFETLREWKTNYSMWDLESYRYHPAWRQRYLHCACYNYAVAHARVYGKPVEMMTDREGGLVHVYNVTKRKRLNRRYIKCYDMDGTHSRYIIKKKYEIPHSRVHIYDDEEFEPYRFRGELYMLERWIRAIQ